MFLVFKRYVPFDVFGVGSKNFSGNHRQSADLHGSAKTWGRIEVDLSDMSLGTPVAWSDETIRYNVFTGAEIGRATAGVPITIKQQGYSGLARYIRLHTGGKNPHTPASATPDIDTFLDAYIFKQKDGRVKIWGMLSGDPFPNGEVFVESRTMKNNQLLCHFVTRGGDRAGVRLIFGVNFDTLAKFEETFDSAWLMA